MLAVGVGLMLAIGVGWLAEAGLGTAETGLRSAETWLPTKALLRATKARLSTKARLRATKARLSTKALLLLLLLLGSTEASLLGSAKATLLVGLCGRVEKREDVVLGLLWFCRGRAAVDVAKEVVCEARSGRRCGGCC